MATIKLSDVIADVKSTNRGKYTDDIIVHWLNDIEEKIFTEIVLTHEGNEDIISAHVDADGLFVLYTADNVDSELIVPSTYASLYKHYIDSQIYYSNGETTKYNNALASFNAAYGSYFNWYNRTHTPYKASFNFFGGKK